MAVEPVQDLVKLTLEADGYFVRSNVRYKVEGKTATGKTGAYGDLDILAVKIDADSGIVQDRIWGEVKGHLTNSLTPGYIRGFPGDYAVMLGDAAWCDPRLKQKLGEHKLANLKHRQNVARERASEILGGSFRQVLYFGGRKPRMGGAEARLLLNGDLEIVYVRDSVGAWVERLSHLEGNEEFVRVINVLREYGLLRVA